MSERVTSERRDEILAIAAELFAAQGFAHTTVREIADAAGILSGSLYHHFESKESMLDEILRTYLDDIVACYRTTVAAGGDAVETLCALVRAAFGALGTHRVALAIMLDEFNVLVRLPRFAYLRVGADDTEQLWVEVLARGARDGSFRADVEPRLLYRFMRDAIFVSVRWYDPKGSATPDDVADAYLRVLLGGIRCPT